MPETTQEALAMGWRYASAPCSDCWGQVCFEGSGWVDERGNHVALAEPTNGLAVEYCDLCGKRKDAHVTWPPDEMSSSPEQVPSQPVADGRDTAREKPGPMGSTGGSAAEGD